ncbi:MAG: hypothetical protein JXA90_00435, partial [Planctomycetes bacterium]|nr:hypothetical protein [Planctomycetota bacterium]
MSTDRAVIGERVEMAKEQVAGTRRAAGPAAPILSLACCLLCAPAPRAAEIDAVAVKQEWIANSSQTRERVRVRGRWIAGNEPRIGLAEAAEIVDLAAGESAVLRLEPFETLLARPWPAGQDSGALSLWIARGSNLFAPAAWSRKDERSGIIAWSEMDGDACLARLERSRGAGGRLVVGLGIESRRRVSSLEPFRREIRCEAESALLRVRLLDSGERFHRFRAGREHDVPVEGLRRICIISRYIYPPSEARSLQRYRLRLRLDDGSVRWYPVETTAELDGDVRVDGSRRPLGLERRLFVDVPFSSGRLGVLASADVHVRILGEEIRARLLPPPPAASYRLLEDEWTSALRGALDGLEGILSGRGWLEAPIDDLDGAEEALKRLAADNRIRESSLAAVDLARRLALHLGGDARIIRLASRLDGHHGRYAELVPESACERGGAFLAFFERRALDLPGDDREPSLAPSHVPHYLDLQTKLWFHALPGKEASPLIFHLEPREWPSRVRIALVAELPPPAAGGLDIRVQLDEGEARELKVDPQLARRGSGAAPSVGRAARQRWRARAGFEFRGDDAGGWLESPVAVGEELELPLPPDVRRIRLWRR